MGQKYKCPNCGAVVTKLPISDYKEDGKTFHISYVGKAKCDKCGWESKPYGEGLTKENDSEQNGERSRRRINMTFLKQNWIKIISAMIALVFGLYYFLVIVPARNLDAKIADCRILGNEYKTKEKQNNPNRELMFPTWTHNQNLDICIYMNGYYEKEWWNRYIIDLKNDEVVVYSNYKYPSMNDDSDYEYSSGLTDQKYKEKRDELFRGGNIFTD